MVFRLVLRSLSHEGLDFPNVRVCVRVCVCVCVHVRACARARASPHIISVSELGGVVKSKLKA